MISSGVQPKHDAKVGAFACVATIPHLLSAMDGNTGSKKLAINIAETAGMFVPYLGTALTFSQAYHGETAAGDKIGGWDTGARWATLGFALLQLGTDAATFFFGVGVGMRAALVSTKFGTGGAKAVLAAQKAPMMGRAIAKLTSKFAKSGRARYAEKLMQNGRDLEAKLRKLWGNHLPKGFSTGRQTFAGTALDMH